MNIARRLRHTASIPTALALGLVLGSGAIAHAQQIPQPSRAVVQPVAIPPLHLPAVRSLHLPAGTRTSTAERAPTLNVNCNTGGNLQNRIDAASGGATILVKGTCVGNFTVQRSLTLDANRSATLNGNDAGTTLTIDAPDRTVRLLGVTVTGGQSTTGAGILKVDGSLVLDRAKVKGNLATNAGTAVGGGIYSLGGPAITVRNSTISNNRVEGTAGSAVGGAVVAMDRNLSISNSTLSDNVVVMNGNGTAAAGALYLTATRLTVKGSTFAGNEITATGVTGAQAIGSVLYQTTVTDRPTVIANTAMTGNTAEASTTNGSATGVGPLGSNVETVELIHSRVVHSLTEVSSVNGSATVIGNYRPIGLTRLVDSLVADNEIVSLGGTTAVAQGAGFVASRATVTDSSISDNEASADSAAGNSTSVAGGLFAAKLTMARSRVIGNGTHAEATGGDAQAFGGGVYAPDGKLTASTISGNDVTALATGIRTATGVGGAIYGAGMPITNSTIANNVVRAFAPNAAGTAQSYGGGVTMAAAAIKASTIAGNRVLATSPGDEDTVGGGLYASSGVRVSSSILANNEALLGPDCSGGPESKGFVLLRTPSGCALDSKPTDVKNRNPKLGRLRNNGGPTPTMAIAGGSPALNRIPTGPCSVKVDQRGVKRPQGPRCDVGAYERKVG